MTYKRIDINQASIVQELRKIGASVQSMATVGKGCPDLLVGFNYVNYLFEIKDGNKPPSQAKLTKGQVIWHNNWEGNVNIVYCIDDAFKILGVLND